MKNDEPVVHIVDDSQDMRLSIKKTLQAWGMEAQCHASHQDFVSGCDCDRSGCVIYDISCFAAAKIAASSVQSGLRDRGIMLPIIFISSTAEFDLAVTVMKQGAVDFILKPVPEQVLFESVKTALTRDRLERDRRAIHRLAEGRLSSLTNRERDVLGLLIQGKSNKLMAAELGLSPKTVEFHRSRIMLKSRSDSLADLVRMTVLADSQFQPASVA